MKLVCAGFHLSMHAWHDDPCHVLSLATLALWEYVCGQWPVHSYMRFKRLEASHSHVH